MYKYLLIIIIFFAACTPQQRLNRLYKKHPELFSKDTVIVHDTAYVELPVADTSKIDSLLNLLLADSVVKENLITDFNLAEKDQIKKVLVNYTQKQRIAAAIKVLYKEKPCISAGDTLHYSDKGVNVKIWQVGTGLKIAIGKQVITEKANITVTEPKKGLQWYWILLIGILIGGIITLIIRR